MKVFLLALIIIGSLKVMAQDKADFICITESGYRYEYFNKYGELHQYTTDGESDDMQDALIMKLSIYKTFPVQYFYQIGYHDEKEAFMEILFIGDSNIGSGIVFDQTVSCTR